MDTPDAARDETPVWYKATFGVTTRFIAGDDPRLDTILNELMWQRWTVEPVVVLTQAEYDELATLRARVATLEQLATDKGWEAVGLTLALDAIRERLKHEEPVYDELAGWLYGDKEEQPSLPPDAR